MMKKVIGIVGAVALSLSLCACGGGTAESADQGGASPAEGKEAVRSYIADTSYTQSLSAADSGVNAMVEAIKAGDTEKCQSIYTDVEEQCNYVIDAKDVPEGAERLHDCFIGAATAYKDAALNLSLSLTASSAQQQKERYEDATEALKTAEDEMNKASFAMNDISRQLNAEDSD